MIVESLPARRRSVVGGVLVLARPWQWTKNVLVAAAPLAAGELWHRTVLLDTLRAFAAFCLAASAVYCFNDVCDRGADAHHPRKRYRPVASGLVSVPIALGTAAVLAIGALALCVRWQLLVVIICYLAANAAYALALKQVAVVELCLVASGFLLRTIGGGPAGGIPLSPWFLIVAGFGSLFLVTGKRLSELSHLAGSQPITRPILAEYTETYLRMVTTLSAGVTLTAYALWAFEVGTAHRASSWAEVSIVPLVIAFLRYLLDIDAGRAQEPEQILARDRVLQLLAVCWLVTFVLAVVHG